MSSDPEGPRTDQTHVTTAVGGPTVDSHLGEPFLEEASQALMEGNWEAAEDAFYRGVTESPRDARLHGGLALIAIHEKDWKRAIGHGRQASALPGASVEVHNNLGWALEQDGAPAEALRAYVAAFHLDPTRPQPIAHLVRLGEVPQLPEEEDGPMMPLGTLERLELYEHLAGFIQAEPPGNTFRGTYIWAMERGAPWGRVAGWLLQQGVKKDRDVLEVLAQRDEHLGQAIVSGILLGEREAIQEALGSLDGIALVGADDTLPDFVSEPGEDGAPYLVVRLMADEDRAQIPIQRTHAGVVLSFLVSVMDQFGESSGLAMTIDPAAHLGPRRVWLVNPLSEVEVIGTWEVEEIDGTPVEDVPVPDGRTVRANSVLAGFPGVDADSLRAALEEGGLGEAAKALDEGGAVIFDADEVGKIEGWRNFLGRVSKWLPEGERSFVVWRVGGEEQLAILAREGARFLKLVPSWPEDQADLDLPIAPEVQLLGRALFQAPRSGRLMGVKRP